MSDDGTRIRRWTDKDDVSALTRLLNRAYRPLADAGMRYVASWQDDEITLRRLESGEAWVSEAEGRIVAAVVLVPPGPHPRVPYYSRPGVAYFHQFAVDPDFQGRGIGRGLLDHLERRAREVGATELALDTSDGAVDLRRMYERLGYRAVGSQDWAETNYESVILAKNLDPNGE